MSLYIIEKYDQSTLKNPRGFLPDFKQDLKDIDELNLLCLGQVGTLTVLSFMNEFLEQSHMTMFVARHKETNRIIGKQTLYIDLQEDGIRVGTTRQVATHEKYSRMGIANTILENLLREAAAKNVTHVDLTSGPKKTAAHKLYLKHGFFKRDTNNFRWYNPYFKK